MEDLVLCSKPKPIGFVNLRLTRFVGLNTLGVRIQVQPENIPHETARSPRREGRVTSIKSPRKLRD